MKGLIHTYKKSKLSLAVMIAILGITVAATFTTAKYGDFIVTPFYWAVFLGYAARVEYTGRLEIRIEEHMKETGCSYKYSKSILK